MARLLVRATDNGPWRAEDIVHAIEDGQQWGRLETLAGGFYTVDLAGLSLAEALALKEPAEGEARRYQVDLTAIERRLPNGRAVWNSGTISRQWSEVSDVALRVKAR